MGRTSQYFCPNPYLFMKTALPLILFAITISARAQGYLVTTKGDTIKGKINFQLLSRIEMANVKGATKETISATSVRSVFTNGKHYKPVQFNGTIQFMEILIDGYLSLLGFKQPNAVLYEGRVLQKRDGKIIEVANIGFKKQVSSFLSDAPNLSKEILDGNLVARDLQEIINQYNAFIEKQTLPKSNSASANEMVQNNAASKTKIDLLEALRLDIEKSDLPQKQDALDILLDWSEKIKNNKPIPPYLQKALKTSVDLRTEFLIRIDELTRP